MNILAYFAIIGVMVMGCSPKSSEKQLIKPSSQQKNITPESIAGMSWMNKPEAFEVKDSSLLVTVVEGTDFFNNPEDSSVVGSAPYLYQSVQEDFMAWAWVRPDFSGQWNAVALMVHIDSVNWIKFAFENSDATGPSIVSVVTRTTSDDANGVVLGDNESIWLSLVRKGNLYAMHWSVDGENYTMARLTAMPESVQVKIGLEMQSPVGEEATHQVMFWDIDRVSVKNLRNINL